MQKKLLEDLKSHIKKTTSKEHLPAIHSLSISIVELAASQDVSDISVNLPLFMKWNGLDHAPVEKLIEEWGLDTFIQRAKSDLK
jgi:hypothetical protein